MRKTLACFLLFALVLSLAGCGGNAKEVTVLDMESELYTQEDYLAAVDAVKSYFQNFQGCTLKEISYAGDEKVQKEWEYILGFGDYSEGIVLMSTFDVDKNGGDGSLEPNSTYYGWGWYLARRDGGSWTVVTCGYG